MKKNDPVHELNRLVYSTFPSEITGLIPYKSGEVTANKLAVTLIPNEPCAFDLKSVVLNTLTPPSVCEKEIGTNGAVWRGILSYAQAKELIKNPTAAIFHTALLVNQGLCELTASLGDLSDREITLHNFAGHVYSSSTTNAGYEIRIVVR